MANTFTSGFLSSLMKTLLAERKQKRMEQMQEKQYGRLLERDTVNAQRKQEQENAERSYKQQLAQQENNTQMQRQAKGEKILKALMPEQFGESDSVSEQEAELMRNDPDLYRFYREKQREIRTAEENRYRDRVNFAGNKLIRYNTQDPNEFEVFDFGTDEPKPKPKPRAKTKVTAAGDERISPELKSHLNNINRKRSDYKRVLKLLEQGLIEKAPLSKEVETAPGVYQKQNVLLGRDEYLTEIRKEQANDIESIKQEIGEEYIAPYRDLYNRFRTGDGVTEDPAAMNPEERSNYFNAFKTMVKNIAKNPEYPPYVILLYRELLNQEF